MKNQFEDIFTNDLNISLSENIKQKVTAHRQQFYGILISRYLELLPHLINYESNINTIDFILLELMLRNGKSVVIGESKNKNLKILGYIQNDILLDDFDNINRRRFIKDDITFIVNDDEILENYTEITNNDNCKTGNFIVVRNKIINYINDISIIKYYADELAEIALSRYSTILQMKINTFFLGDVNDESINQLVQDVYNGSPFVKVTKFFDKDDNIITLQNHGISQNLIELKREYQNKISELNTMLGIYNTSVDKESGISSQELNSSSGFTYSNSNIYLASRELSFNKLNKRYNIKIYPKFNDLVNSEFLQMEKQIEIPKDNQNDNNNNLQNFDR